MRNALPTGSYETHCADVFFDVLAEVISKRTAASPVATMLEPKVAPDDGCSAEDSTKRRKVLARMSVACLREIEEQMLAKLQKPSKPKKGKDGKEHNRGCVERAPYPYHPPLLRNRE